MIERDLQDSFPESSFTTWTCPACGGDQQVMLADLEAVDCPACEQRLLSEIDTDWFDLLDPVEREVA